jgi:hypothetical protein
MGSPGKAHPNGKSQGKQSRKSPQPKNPDNKPPTHSYPRIPTSFPMGPNPTNQSLANPSLAIPHPNLETAHYRGLRLKAEAALEQLLSEESVPPNVRAAAARTLLELVGAIGARAPKHEAEQGLDDAGLEPEGLSLADIDRELRRLVT